MERDTTSDGRLKIVAVGDMNLQHRNRPVSAFEHVVDEFEQADLLVGNLEGCFADPAVDIKGKAGWFHSDKSMAKGLVEAGFDAVWCANNVHYGADMIMESLAVLDENGIAHVGAGADLLAARKPGELTKGGVKFGFLSYSSVFFPLGHAAGPDTPGIATVRGVTYYEPHPRVFEMPGAPARTISFPDPVELESMRDDIRALKSRVDILIVAFHWGVSGSQETAMYQVTLGHEAIDCGADLVLGQHPHTPQGVEVYKGGVIFYSLGNFVFDWNKMSTWRDGLLVRGVVEDRTLKRVSFVPVTRNDEGQPYILGREDGRDIVDTVTRLSDGFGTSLRVDGEEVVVVDR